MNKENKAILFLCGNSLNEFSSEHFRKEAKNHILLFVKQSYKKLAPLFSSEQVSQGYHFFNCANLPKANSLGQHYTYKWGQPYIIVSSTYQLGIRISSHQIKNEFYKIESFRGIHKTMLGDKKENWDKYLFEEPFHGRCYPGILGEIIWPLIIREKFTTLKIYGWDLNLSYQHFYTNNNLAVKGHFDKIGISLQIERLYDVRDWLLEHNCKIEVRGNNSRIRKLLYDKDKI